MERMYEVQKGSGIEGTRCLQSVVKAESPEAACVKGIKDVTTRPLIRMLNELQGLGIPDGPGLKVRAREFVWGDYDPVEDIRMTETVGDWSPWMSEFELDLDRPASGYLH